MSAKRLELPADTVGLLEGLTTTRTVRRIKPDPVSDDELATVCFAATRAPSGSNRQPFRLLVLRDGPRAGAAKALLGESFRRAWAAKRASDAYEQGSGSDPSSPKARMARAMQRFVDRFEQVPVVVLACLVPHRQAGLFEGASVYPACQNLLLAARAVGLGGVMTQWHAPVEAELRPLLGIPDGVVVAATLALGHPEGNHGPVRRRPVEELVFDDGWGCPARWAAEPAGTRHTRAGPPT
jgi:nitroreductase